MKTRHRHHGVFPVIAFGVCYVVAFAALWSRSMFAQELPESVRRLERQGKVDLHRNEKGVIATAYFHGTDDELRILCDVETLEALDCSLNFDVTDRGIAEIGRLKNLRVLHLADTNTTAAGLSFLPKLVQLRELYCNPKVDTDKAVDAILKLPKLAKLDLGGGKFTDKDVQRLCTLESLEELGLELNVALTDEGMRDIAKVPVLKRLSISDMPLGDKACEYISACPSLRVLSVGTNVTDRGVEKLLMLRRLEKLDLGRTKITAASLKLVGTLPELRYLSIMDDNFGDEVVPILAKFKKLESLNWLGNRLSEKGAAQLAASRNWKVLIPDPEDEPFQKP